MNLVPEAYRGLDRFEARKAVVADINAEGLSVETVRITEGDDGENVQVIMPLVESKKIMQPFGDRSKVVIEPALTDQWFVDTDQIVGPALDAVRDGTVKLVPEREEKVYFHWLENIEPWCISRQLWWGHQIPVWFDTDGNQYCAENFEAAAMQVRSMHGADVDVREKETGDEFILPGELKRPNPEKGQSGNPAGKMTTYKVVLERDPDVLDTWFSSGLWPVGTLGWPEQTPELDKYFPSSTLITGTDILFFWVARMMMMQLSVLDQDKPAKERIPFDTVYLHGLVRDAKGKKMSKSTGNVVDPLEIIDEFGADALRFTNAAMASLGGTLKLDTQRIAGYRNFGTKLWNACRFAEMNGVFEGPRTKNAADLNAQFTVNKWIIGETAKVLDEVNTALEAFRFNDAASGLYGFVWGKVCDWYVELSKPLLQGDDVEKREETQRVMAWILDQCLILLHPIMPFITEELWATLGAHDDMLVVTDWPTYIAADLVNDAADAEMNWVISVIEGIRSARSQMNVPAGLKIPVVQTEADAAAVSAWANNEEMIKRLARVDSMAVSDTTPKGALTVAAHGATYALPLANIIDVDAEKARLTKNLGKLAKELGGLRGRLNNPKFAQSAPAEVVEEAKGNLALREEEEAQIKAALARLNEI
jgi:valyl-tRNA synthetase